MSIAPNRKRAFLWMFFGVSAAGMAAVVSPSYQLRYNTSQSAPVGWYVIVPERDLTVGTFALAKMPVATAALADERGYLPKNVPILKRVEATAGQSICARGDQVLVDGVTVARSLSHDGQGRHLAAWKGCRRLSDGELFLLNTASKASFDSRYFGPIARPNVIGRAIPLWTW